MKLNEITVGMTVYIVDWSWAIAIIGNELKRPNCYDHKDDTFTVIAKDVLVPNAPSPMKDAYNDLILRSNLHEEIIIFTNHMMIL